MRWRLRHADQGIGYPTGVAAGLRLHVPQHFSLPCLRAAKDSSSNSLMSAARLAGTGLLCLAISASAAPVVGAGGTREVVRE